MFFNEVYTLRWVHIYYRFLPLVSSCDYTRVCTASDWLKIFQILPDISLYYGYLLQRSTKTSVSVLYSWFSTLYIKHLCACILNFYIQLNEYYSTNSLLVTLQVFNEAKLERKHLVAISGAENNESRERKWRKREDQVFSWSLNQVITI